MLIIFKKKSIILPKGYKKLLLHSCCSPCACYAMELLQNSNINFSIFFYNPNVHPKKEYILRKNENIRFAKKLNIPFIDVDYDKNNWFNRIKGLEFEPERGKRCTLCFDMRFERTALYAYENNFSIITSVLGISRWKDLDQINKSGLKAVSRYSNMIYWTFNWRKKGGSLNMITISKREKFYQQQYCGCVYSLRDTNKHRIKNNRNKIQIGKNYYQ
ncbi:epoxyqueuosine reductase QueH [Candidatus Tachikawaea gelatinosa]|uniref:Epoxyqueuosine reductase QueH n=1 Tax=Candidatus Tachikawaea gelatinosa TaxID=1410383 RepID=A0A090AQ31_9ENTR|nr:epoxyqueuosine reductase QueH [Candidatus Tachikawaea gelatinosa]BAP58437.1 hypothetical protein TGUWTKB_1930 [Candidatus Tachikawaea gelatinosa]